MFLLSDLAGSFSGFSGCSLSLTFFLSVDFRAMGLSGGSPGFVGSPWGSPLTVVGCHLVDVVCRGQGVLFSVLRVFHHSPVLWASAHSDLAVDHLEFRSFFAAGWAGSR